MCKAWKHPAFKDTLGALMPQDRRTKERLDSSEDDLLDAPEVAEEEVPVPQNEEPSSPLFAVPLAAFVRRR